MSACSKWRLQPGWVSTCLETLTYKLQSTRPAHSRIATPSDACLSSARSFKLRGQAKLMALAHATAGWRPPLRGKPQVEADSYWCLCKLLDGIQDHYTYAQPGIQRTVFHLKELVRHAGHPKRCIRL